MHMYVGAKYNSTKKQLTFKTHLIVPYKIPCVGGSSEYSASPHRFDKYRFGQQTLHIVRFK